AIVRCRTFVLCSCEVNRWQFFTARAAAQSARRRPRRAARAGRAPSPPALRRPLRRDAQGHVPERQLSRQRADHGEQLRAPRHRDRDPGRGGDRRSLLERPTLLGRRPGEETVKSRCAIAIHGGAGKIRRATTRLERPALERALQAGYRILQDGGSSLDAVAAAVATLEDAGVFNAGRGAAPNGDGEIELDAGIMDGATLRAGGVAAVR